MDIGIPSRFAVLKIEGETESMKSKDKKVEIKKANTKKSKEKEVKQKPKGNIVGKKESKANQPSHHQTKSSKPSNTSKKDKKRDSKDQWEEWKEKDNQIVNGHFEEDLQNAILLSKLDYEEKKDLYKQKEKEVEMEKTRAQNKKKKNKIMSLDQFLGSGSNEASKEVEKEKLIENPHDDSFFDKIKQEAQQEINKEEIKELRKKREEKIDEIISLAQLQDKLDKERKKNEELRKELDKAKIEIAAVKERNKILCDILGHGEMKDKADVLLELERLNSVKNELTEEVSRLHVLLEQERSKVAALESQSNQNTKHKDKKSKK